MKSSPSAPIGEYIRQEWQFAPVMNADTDAIACAIWSHARPGRWLDLGCGPLLSIWPLFSESASEVYGLDRNTEVRDYHSEVMRLPFAQLPSDLIEAYAGAGEFRDRHGLHPISDPRTLVKDIRIQSLLYPVRGWTDKFDTVVQIGCFGCLDSIEQLRLAIRLVSNYLKPGGIFISATWTPVSTYMESDVWGGSRLRSLDADVFVHALQAVSCEVLNVDRADLEDKRYAGRFVLVARKLPLNDRVVVA